MMQWTVMVWIAMAAFLACVVILVALTLGPLAAYLAAHLRIRLRIFACGTQEGPVVVSRRTQLTRSSLRIGSRRARQGRRPPATRH